MVALQDGRILCATQFASSTVFYTPETDTWTPAAGSPSVIRAAAARGRDGRVHFFGGEYYDGTPSGVVTTYDPVANRWSGVTSAPSPRDNAAAAALLDGRIFVLGGVEVRFGSTTYNTTAFFDPTTMTTSTGPAMPTARAYFQAAQLADRRVMVVGDGTTVNMYNVTTGAWTAVASLPVRRGRFALQQLTDGRVLLIGGGDTIYYASTRVTTYYPAEDRWE